MSEDQQDMQLFKPKKPQAKINNLSDFPVFGWYLVFFLCLSETILLPQMANMTYMVYAGFSPTIEGCEEHTFTNMSNSERCVKLEELRSATNCTPKLSAQFESLAYEFHYYCSNAHQIKNSISVQMIGVLIGAVLSGQLSDLFGRRRVMLVCAAGMALFNILAASASNLSNLTLLQFAALFFAGGTSTISHVHLMETVPKKYRVWSSIVICYSPNYIIFAVIAYYAHNWRVLLQIMGALSVVTVVFLWIVSESPRWLVQDGQLEEAKRTYEKIERFNGTWTAERQEILEVLIQKEVELLEQKKKAQKYYFHHLFYTWKMIRYSLVLSFSLLCTAVINYSLIWNMEKLSGSVYLNNILLGCIRYFFNIVFGVCDYKFKSLGRKLVHRCALAFVIAMLLIVFAIKAFHLPFSLAMNLATLSAIAMCSQLFIVGLVVTGELFPTPVRNTAASFQQIFTRFGVVMSPHFFYFTSFWAPAPYLFMAACMLLNIVFFYMLIPETKGKAMSDHMPDKSERIFAKKCTEMTRLEKPLVREAEN